MAKEVRTFERPPAQSSLPTNGVICCRWPDVLNVPLLQIAAESRRVSKSELGIFSGFL